MYNNFKILIQKLCIQSRKPALSKRESKSGRTLLCYKFSIILKPRICFKLYNLWIRLFEMLYIFLCNSLLGLDILFGSKKLNQNRPANLDLVWVSVQGKVSIGYFWTYVSWFRSILPETQSVLGSKKVTLKSTSRIASPKKNFSR